LTYGVNKPFVQSRVVSSSWRSFNNASRSNTSIVSSKKDNVSNVLLNSIGNRKVTRPLSTSTESIPSYLLQTPPYQQTILSNQIRVASEETPGEVATIGVWIDAGSRYEKNEHNNGVAHFLEHMAFKGTEKRTRTHIEQEIEDMGGSLNAFTSREHTVYQAKVFKNDVPRAMDILSDILLHSKYDNRAIEQEKGTILREYEEVQKDTQEVIFDHLHAAAFQGSSLGYTILGSQANIQKIQRQDLVDFVNTHYVGRRIAVTGAGAVDHKQLVGLSEKLFGQLPANSKVQDSVQVKAPFTGSSLEVRDDAMEEVNFVLGFEGLAASHPDYFALLVIQNIVGTWEKTIGGGKNLSSRLCEIVGTEELASTMNCFNTVYRDTGLFGVHASALPEKTEDLTWEILNEFTRIGKTVTNVEVDRAKNRLKAALLMNLDGTAAISEDIGRQILTHGRRLTPAETLMRINAVTTQDVMRVASNITYDKEPVLVYMGQTKLFPEYHRVRGWTYWARW